MKRLHEIRPQSPADSQFSQAGPCAQTMPRPQVSVWFGGVVLALWVGACSLELRQFDIPAFQQSNFTNPTVINHPSLPLIPGTTPHLLGGKSRGR